MALAHPVLSPSQMALFGREEVPTFDSTFASLERIELEDGAWIELARGWLAGHAKVFDSLARGLASPGTATTWRVGWTRRAGGGPSTALRLGWGDLIVIGGSCQRTYQHAIPKVSHGEPRISIMYRPVWKE